MEHIDPTSDNFDFPALMEAAIGLGEAGLFIMGAMLELAREEGVDVPEGLGLPRPDPNTVGGYASLVGLYAQIYGLTYLPLTFTAAGIHSVKQARNYYEGKEMSAFQVIEGRGFADGFMRWAARAFAANLFLYVLRIVMRRFIREPATGGA